MQLRPVVSEYLDSIKRLRPLTRKGYEDRLDVFVSWCEVQKPVIELEMVNAKAVDNFLDYLRKNHKSHYVAKPELSTHTLAGYVRCIKVFLHWCMDSEDYDFYIRPYTVRRIKPIKKTKNIVEIFTKDQLQALFDACQQEFDDHLRIRDYAILAVLLDTGIRAKELCTLTIENTHLEPDDAYITVLGKGDKWREVGLGTFSRKALYIYITMFRNADVRLQIAKALQDAALAKGKALSANEEALLKQRLQKSAIVFVTRYHKEFTVWGLERVITRLGHWAQVTKVRCSPHTFRHTYACNYLLSGGELFKLSLLLGHEDVETTQIYLRTVRAREARKGMSVLDIMGLKDHRQAKTP